MPQPSAPAPLTSAAAASRIAADHELLLSRTAGLCAAQLSAPYRPVAGPLGDFCESLHDLVAHVLMWDEINLATLSEAAADRTHWSLDPRWETPEMGRRLNRAGVEAGRQLPGPLLVERVAMVRDAILAELPNVTDLELLERIWTVPGQSPYWHAAVHLGQLPAIGGERG